MSNKSVLMVVTSHAELGETGQKTGFWLEELAAPYLTFKEHGAHVDVASIQGGAVPVDPKSDDDKSAATQKFKADPANAELLKSTHKLGDVDLAKYGAIFLVGGHGTCWDFPTSGDLKKAIEDFYNTDRIVSAVCHGPVGLTSAVGKDGKPIVHGKKVTGFSNEEENAVKLQEVVPFLLEEKLKELGGVYSRGPTWQSHVVFDGKLVTGQNPGSSEEAAKKVLELMA